MAADEAGQSAALRISASPDVLIKTTVRQNEDACGERGHRYSTTTIRTYERTLHVEFGGVASTQASFETLAKADLVGQVEESITEGGLTCDGDY